MSETVHYKGKAKKLSDPYLTTLGLAQKILKDKGLAKLEYYDNEIEHLVNDLGNDFFYYPKTNTLYEITVEGVDADDDIIRANFNQDGTIDYELRFYNGGTGFEECLEEAFDNLDFSENK